MSYLTKSHESHQRNFIQRTLIKAQLFIGINIGDSWFELMWKLTSPQLNILCPPIKDHETPEKWLRSIDEKFILYHPDNLLCTIYKH